MSDLSRRLIKLKEQIEIAQRNKDRTEGRLESLRETLKKEFKISSTKQASIKLSDLEKQIDKLKIRLHKKIKYIEENYPQ